IRIASGQTTVRPDYNRVDRPDPFGRGVNDINDLERLFFQRNGEICAAKEISLRLAVGGELPQRCGEVFRLYRPGAIFRSQRVFVDPEAMQARRQRMADRPAHDPGDLVLMWRHDVNPILWPRRKSRSGNRGSPRMEKKSPSTREKRCAPRPSR